VTAIHPNHRVFALDLQGAEVDDRWLKRLNCFSGIKSLSLNRTGVTMDGLFSLVVIEQLETLHLTGSQVNDTTLTRLGRLPCLRELHLGYGAVVSDEALDRLRAARPGLMVSVERPTE
jgi:hypothetical protein